MAVLTRQRNEILDHFLNGDAITETIYIQQNQDSDRFFYCSKLKVTKKTIFELASEPIYETLVFVENGKIEVTIDAFGNSAIIQEGDVFVLYSGSKQKVQLKLVEDDMLYIVQLSLKNELFVGDKSFVIYKSEEFPFVIGHARDSKIIMGENCPFEFVNYPVQIKETLLSYKVHKQILFNEASYHYIILSGKVSIEKRELKTGDYCFIENEKEIILNVKEDTRIFQIEEVS